MGDNPGAHVVMWKRKGGPHETASGDGPEPGSDEWIEKVVREEATGEEGGGADRPGLMGRLAKLFGWGGAEIEKASEVYEPPDYDEIQGGKVRGRILEEITDRVMSLLDALQMGIMAEDVEGALGASLDQFEADMREAIPAYGSGKTTYAKAGKTISVARLRRLKDFLTRTLAELEGAPAQKPPAEETTKRKEGEQVAKFDKARVAEILGRPESEVTDEQLAKFNEHAVEAPEPVEKVVAEPADPEEAEFQKVLTSAPEGMREYLKKQRAEQLADRASLRKKLEEDADRKYVGKARDHGFTNAEEMGPVLRRMAEGVPEKGDVDKVMAANKATVERAKVPGGLLREVAKNGDPNEPAGEPGEAMTEATEKAHGLMEKDPDKYANEAVARRAVYKANPKLAERVADEQRRAS